ncbi:DoxX family membrane protein [Gordonia sp. TBRC 11910]|uniref:DoxX family membrane protein n=1 Tax=Gordonia asplenii TaxID=2725283 RepID=A0A848KPM7_9ACTN|nr:DoxX family membrane protein [Gordonia asplenii]NMO00192.1 DoxX family membrane protein [Gordonia asplenii]
MSVVRERSVAVAATVARVALGLLWLHEGYVKYHAGFGRSDILLVVGSTANNPRVPHFYTLFTNDVLGRFPGLFGFVVPLIEVGLGVALVLGILTPVAAAVSVLQLCSYWFADQLITQYPIMVALSAAVLAFGSAASVYSVTAVVLRRRRDASSRARGERQRSIVDAIALGRRPRAVR